MNVPSPAPCHVNVAGVGKQSVWGLRIIAYISVYTLTSFYKFVNTKSGGLTSELPTILDPIRAQRQRPQAHGLMLPNDQFDLRKLPPMCEITKSHR
jgi:hypothetical protein